jgi:hypothetical protein
VAVAFAVTSVIGAEFRNDPVLDCAEDHKK